MAAYKFNRPDSGLGQGKGPGGRNQQQSQQQQAMGPSGRCICPKCEEIVSHQRGVPCQNQACPVCGSKMLRENGFHHQLLQQKKSRSK